MSIGQHTLLFRARRGIAIALAVADVFARGTDLESLQAKNTRAPLEGEDAAHFKKLLSASAYVSAFAFASYLWQLIDSDGEAPNDIAEPNFLFDTAQDAIKSVVAGLDHALVGAKDDADLATRAKAFARVAIDGLLTRKGRFDGLGAFEDAHIRIDADDFTLDGFDVAPGKKSKPLVMTLQEAGRGRRQPHRKIPVGQARQDAHGLRFRPRTQPIRRAWRLSVHLHRRRRAGHRARRR